MKQDRPPPKRRPRILPTSSLEESVPCRFRSIAIKPRVRQRCGMHQAGREGIDDAERQAAFSKFVSLTKATTASQMSAPMDRPCQSVRHRRERENNDMAEAPEETRDAESATLNGGAAMTLAGLSIADGAADQGARPPFRCWLSVMKWQSRWRIRWTHYCRLSSKTLRRGITKLSLLIMGRPNASANGFCRRRRTSGISTFHPTRLPSPAAAMNRAAAEARAELLCLMIDGARMVTPGGLSGDGDDAMAPRAASR